VTALAAAESADPRVARSRAAILRATADLLIEHGFAGVTVDGVADRSGVAKTTIYRHWKDRSQLVFDAFASLLRPSNTAPGERLPVDEALAAMLNGLVRGLTLSEWAPAVATMIEAGDRDPEVGALVRNFLAERMEHGKSVLRSAVSNGELRTDLDVDVAIGALVGPVFYRRLVSREHLDETVVRLIVQQFLDGATRPI
jgi:AcrR family transcriptional regulator